MKAAEDRLGDHTTACAWRIANFLSILEFAMHRRMVAGFYASHGNRDRGQAPGGPAVRISVGINAAPNFCARQH
jgi:hypothetical protein